MSDNVSVQLVWFKRDLRVDEFEALHLHFINDSLGELGQNLRELGIGLTLRVGEAVDIIQELHQEHSIDTIWAHGEPETGSLTPAAAPFIGGRSSRRRTLNRAR